jgi:hypothetical protein
VPTLDSRGSNRGKGITGYEREYNSLTNNGMLPKSSERLVRITNNI